MPNNTPQHCALLSYNLHVCPAICTLVLQFAHMSYNVCACPTVCARVLEFAPMSLELWTHAQSGTRAQNGTYDHKLSHFQIAVLCYHHGSKCFYLIDGIIFQEVYKQ